MPGDSLQRDLGEVLEYWGEPERLGISSWEIARYLTTALVGLTDVLRALPEDDPNAIADTSSLEKRRTLNAEAGAEGQPASVGAQVSLHFVDSKPVGGSHG